MDKDIDYDDPNLSFKMLRKGMMMLNPYEGLTIGDDGSEHVRKLTFEYLTKDDPRGGTTRLIFTARTKFHLKFYDAEDVKGIIKFFQGYLDINDG